MIDWLDRETSSHEPSSLVEAQCKDVQSLLCDWFCVVLVYQWYLFKWFKCAMIFHSQDPRFVPLFSGSRARSIRRKQDRLCPGIFQSRSWNLSEIKMPRCACHFNTFLWFSQYFYTLMCPSYISLNCIESWWLTELIAFLGFFCVWLSTLFLRSRSIPSWPWVQACWQKAQLWCSPLKRSVGLRNYVM